MLKKFLLYFISNILLTVTLHASTITVFGNVSGIWNTDTVVVSDNITILQGSSLTIQPGCRIIFRGLYKIKQLGNLIATGSAQKIIYFERDDTTGLRARPLIDVGSWAGIWMPFNTTGYSELRYCQFRHMKSSGSIVLAGGTSLFQNCTFSDNVGTVISIEAKGHFIKYSVISNNSGFGIAINAKDSVFIQNNTFANNSSPNIYYLAREGSACILTNNIFWGSALVSIFYQAGGASGGYPT